MLVRKMNSCSDPKNAECSNYVDTDADPNPKQELTRDYRGLHRSKFPAKTNTEVLDFVGKFDAKKAYDVVMKNIKTTVSNPNAIRSAITRANTDVVPPEVKAKALLSDAAYLKDPVKAQEFLDANGTDLIVLSEHTNEFMTTAIDAEGKVVVAFRGTEPTSLGDLYNDARIIQGAKRHFKTERNALDKVVAEYGKENIELTGHSLGGNKAIELGRQIGINTETFNPLIGRDSLTRAHPNTRNTVWGTTDDLASQLAEYGDFDVKRMKPLKSSLNPIEGHAAKNFYEIGERRSDFRDVILEEALQAGKKFGELELVNDMKESSLTFKAFMADHSPRDILEDGALSNRVNKASRMVEIWEELGKPFTYQENLEIASKPTPNTKTTKFTTTEERSNISNETIDEARNDMIKKMERVNGENEAHSKLASNLIDAVHPVALAKGTIASLAGAGVVEFIDPDHKLNEDVHQGLAGATGGVLTELAIAGTAVTASSALAGASAGLGGAIAGYETQKAVEKAMRNAGINEDATGSLSGMTGGAVAGATTAVVAIGAGAVMGAEVGALGGPLGIAVGTGIGTIAGLAGWGFGKLFHHDDDSPSAEEIAEKQRREETNILRAKQRDEVKARREAYWKEHPYEKAQLDSELRAKDAAQEIDTRPQRTFKGKGRRSSGTHLGTYDTREKTGVKPIPLTDTSDSQTA